MSSAVLIDGSGTEKVAGRFRVFRDCDEGCRIIRSRFNAKSVDRQTSVKQHKTIDVGE